MTQKKLPRSKNPPTPRNDLSEEIHLLREFIRQVARQAEESGEPVDLQDALRSIGEGSAHLATLLRAQKEIASGDDLPDALHQALENILAEIEAEEAQKQAAPAEEPPGDEPSPPGLPGASS